MDATALILFGLGLISLIAGGEALVRGAAQIAARFGISPLVVGLTVVAFCTSAPELAVSVQSTLSGQESIAIGNIVGSNIFNILFILGISALVSPLVVQQQLVRIDVPLMIIASLFLLFMTLDGQISRLDGMILFSILVLYIGFLIRQSHKAVQESRQGQCQEPKDADSDGAAQIVIQVAFILFGVLLLVIGSRWLVEGAVSLARTLGLSELIIGLTIVSAGTSLPEAVTSVVASISGERDIAVGNAVGSNIFNILSVLGLTSIIAPDGLQVPMSVVSFDIPIMIAVAIACLPIFFTGHMIARWEGGLFFAYYVAYTSYLILQSAEHDSLPVFNVIMAAFVIPLTVVTLLILTWRAAHARDYNVL